MEGRWDRMELLEEGKPMSWVWNRTDGSASVRKAQNRIAQREFRMRKQVCAPFVVNAAEHADEIAICKLMTHIRGEELMSDS